NGDPIVIAPGADRLQQSEQYILVRVPRRRPPRRRLAGVLLVVAFLVVEVVLGLVGGVVAAPAGLPRVVGLPRSRHGCAPLPCERAGTGRRAGEEGAGLVGCS